MTRVIALLLMAFAPMGMMLLSSRYLLMLFQLASYQQAGYWRAVRRQYKAAFFPCAVLLAAAVANFLSMRIALIRANSAWLGLGALLFILLLGIGHGVDIWTYRSREGKSSLKFTARIWRFYAVWGLTLVLCFVIFPFYTAMLVQVILCALLPLTVSLIGVVVWPVERLWYELYFQDARRILQERPGLVLIGITGSYGKTSVKFYLQTLLSQKYNVLCSKGSFNTPMGLTSVIRNDLTPAHNVFIAEMGARRRHDIRELCRLIHPAVGILTSVGPQHLETFKTLENVTHTKYDLIRALPQDGFAAFGADNEIVRALYQQTGVEKAIVGRPGDDVWAEDVQTSFHLGQVQTTMIIKTNTGRVIPVSMPLIGKNAVNNVLLAASVALRMGLSDKQLIHGISLIAPIANRFKIEINRDGVYIINNGFNANPVSTKQNLDELSLLPVEGRKIVVTPGFVELGVQQDAYHEQLGLQLAKVCDEVILVGKNRTKSIAKGLAEAGFDAVHIQVFSTLAEANEMLKGFVVKGDLVMYENDLPDHHSDV